MNVISKKEINSICGGINIREITKKAKEKLKETANEITGDIIEAAAQKILEEQQALLEKVL